MFIQGLHRNGCAISVEVAGNRPADEKFVFEIIGTGGRLSLIGGHPYGFQSSDLVLRSNVPFSLPEPAVSPNLPSSAINVAEFYHAIGEDIQTGQRNSKGFDQAAKLTRLVQAVALAGKTGQRQLAVGLAGGLNTPRAINLNRLRVRA
jgi:predicted dehydrogenase